MVWTREDTKDILKKAIGGVIAASLIAVGYVVYEYLTPLTLALLIVVAAVIIVLLFFWLRKEEPRTRAAKEENMTAGAKLPELSEDRTSNQITVIIQPQEPRGATDPSDTAKLEKKRLKAQEKELKKAQKTKKKNPE